MQYMWKDTKKPFDIGDTCPWCDGTYGNRDICENICEKIIELWDKYPELLTTPLSVKTENEAAEYKECFNCGYQIDESNIEKGMIHCSHCPAVVVIIIKED